MKLTVMALLAATLFAQTYEGSGKRITTLQGADNNVKENAFVQPPDAAKAGGGIDQTMQGGDALVGSEDDDLLIGKLGADVMLASHGNDVMIGGPEHGNPLGRDRAFGDWGNDAFLWAPGDGSDFFAGGAGEDTVIFGLIGQVEDGQAVFKVSNDQKAGEVWINPETALPQADVTNQPGFCKVIDKSTSPEAADELRALGLNHLVQFFARGPADAFERGEQTTDNGLRVTLHLKDVEKVVCTSRHGGSIEVLDLTVSPPAPITIWALSERDRALIK